MEYIIPLAEVTAELKGVKGVTSKAVVQECEKIYASLGDEFSILRKLPVDMIRGHGFKLLATAIERIRARDVVLDAGYDGVFGTIKVFKNQEERQAKLNQVTLFDSR